LRLAKICPTAERQRPDDIVKALNGKTIEIDNTDAEGRLTLADALSFTSELGVDEIIDLATLTGACVIALGEYTSGVMGNDKDLISNIISTSQITGERMWELPFDDNMKKNFQVRLRFKKRRQQIRRGDYGRNVSGRIRSR
jgi:Leucyl aminopeptidase